jgi:hypothetical protein
MNFSSNINQPGAQAGHRGQTIEGEFIDRGGNPQQAHNKEDDDREDKDLNFHDPK